MALSIDTPPWRTSSRSSGGACVEVQAGPDEIRLRDSKNRGAGVLAFDRPTFGAFLDAVRAGEFDRR